MNRKYRFIHSSMLATCAYAVSAVVNAQSIPVIEDFSHNTALWRITTWDQERVGDVSEGTQFSINDDHIQLTVVGDEASPHRGIVLRSPYKTDSGVNTYFSVDVKALAESVIQPGGELRTRIQHNFYNALADRGFPDREDDSSREGDVEADLRMQFGADYSRASICMKINNSLGQEEDLLIFDDGQDNCHRFELEPVLGETYRLTVFGDPDTGTASVSVGEESFEFQLPHNTFYAPNDDKADIEVTSDGVGDISILDIYRVESDTFVDDYTMSGPPTVAFDDAWVVRGSGDQRPTVENGRLRMEVGSEDGSAVQSRLNVRGETDFLQSDLTLSSETQFTALNSDSVAMVRLSGNQYDAYADGGIDGSDIGGVWARIEILMRPDQTTYSQFCLERFDTGAPDYNSTGLLGDDGFCKNFALIPMLDESYTASIVTDRADRTVSFTLGNETYVHNIVEEEIFNEGFDRQYNAVRARLENSAGVVVGFADNLRTTQSVVENDTTISPDDTTNDGAGNQDPNCPDTDGDGYGWNGSATCFPFGIDPLADNGMDNSAENPYDGVACIDSDGDGWGWQEPANAPGRSCQVTTPVNDNDIYTDVPCIDSDNDGWGWQEPVNGPGRSCQVTIAVNDSDIYSGVPCVDNDNDGWGWQQPEGFPGRSCRI